MCQMCHFFVLYYTNRTGTFGIVATQLAYIIESIWAPGHLLHQIGRIITLNLAPLVAIQPRRPSYTLKIDRVLLVLSFLKVFFSASPDKPPRARVILRIFYSLVTPPRPYPAPPG
jgi:hypothetical protein